MWAFLTRLPLVATIITFVCVVIMFALGNWQLQRAEQKSQRLQSIENASKTAKMDLKQVMQAERQEMLDMPTIGALDVRNQCSGFIYAMSVADQFIKTGMYKNILVIGAENHSGGLERSTRGRNVTVIFGDGAGAAVLSRSEEAGKGILSSHLHSEGKHAKELVLEGPSTGRWVPEILEKNDPDDTSYYPYMNGQFVFKHAITRFSEAIVEGLQVNNLQKDDIDMLIPHQANLRIAQFIQKKFQLSDDKVYNNIMKYGNTTAASVIIALTEAWELGKIKDNDLVVLAAFGSGFTWGSVIIRW